MGEDFCRDIERQLSHSAAQVWLKLNEESGSVNLIPCLKESETPAEENFSPP